MSTETLTPGQRLVRARWQLRLIAESWVSELEPPAGSDEARDLYGSLTVAARELVKAQDAFDSSCAEKPIPEMQPHHHSTNWEADTCPICFP